MPIKSVATDPRSDNQETTSVVETASDLISAARMLDEIGSKLRGAQDRIASLQLQERALRERFEELKSRMRRLLMAVH